MPPKETPEEIQRQAFEKRFKYINDAADGLSKALMTVATEDGAPPQLAGIIADGLTLVKCGLLALTEIADAQQRLVALSERDMAAEVEASAKDWAEVKAHEMVEATTKRGWLGKKPE